MSSSFSYLEKKFNNYKIEQSYGANVVLLSEVANENK